MFKTKFKFRLEDDPAQWRMVVHEILKEPQGQRFVLIRNTETVFDETYESGAEVLHNTRNLRVEDYDFDIEFGAVSLAKYGLIIRRNDEILWRSSKKPFRKAGKFDAAIANMEVIGEDDPSPETQAMLERQKKLRPSIIIDISFGVLFFFVAREFGLVTAALGCGGDTGSLCSAAFHET